MFWNTGARFSMKAASASCRSRVCCAKACMDDAKEKIDAWRTYYNEVRPHSALKWQAPAEYARQHLADGQIANLNEPEISTSDPD